METDTKIFTEGFIFAVLDSCNLVTKLNYEIFLRKDGCLDRIELKPFEGAEKEFNFDNLIKLNNTIINSHYDEIYEFGLYVNLESKMFIIK